MTTLVRRPRIHVALAVGLALAAAGCDTGDGKTLQPYDSGDYPSQTDPPPTIDEFDVSDAGGEFGAPPTPDTGLDGVAEPFGVYAPWQQGATIDARHTCDGEDVAPAVSWGGVPAGTAEIALALVDDSAVSDGQPYVHWVIAGLDPSEIALVEGDVPATAVQAINFFGNVGYDGPCPASTTPRRRSRSSKPSSR